VLVHGTLVSAAQWVNYPALLGPDVEVVAPDLPGHGSAAGTRFTFEGALATIDDAVGNQDLPVVLAGHSLGGYLALAWASGHGDRLAALALLGAAGDPSAPLAKVYSGATKLFQRIGIERLDRMVNRNAGRIVPPDAIEAVRAGGVSYASVPDSWPAVLDNVRPAMLDTVGCPVLFVGGQYDQLRMHTRRFLEHTRDGQVVVIPRATHLFPMTHQRPTAEVLRAFINRVTPT
jgi:pimeloyl-ACP methyl ester carboxylesterase